MDLLPSFNAEEFFNALKNNDADKITSMLSYIDKEELKSLLLSEVENSKPYLFTGGYPINLVYLSDAKCLSIILDKLRPSFHLDILLANSASKKTSSFYQPIYRFIFTHGGGVEQSNLEVMRVIQQHLSPEDWSQLVFTTDSYGETLINHFLRRGDEKFHGCLKLLLDSLDATDRVPLIQLRGFDGRSASSSITPGPVGLKLLKLLAGCLQNRDLLNLFQSGFRDQIDESKHKSSTLIHQIASLTEYQDTVGFSERYVRDSELLMTRDSDGNTPLHLLRSGGILPFIFEMLQDGHKNMSLLTARNHNGDSLLHVIGDISSHILQALFNAESDHITQLLSMQNFQGDTILHKCLYPCNIVSLVEGLYPLVTNKRCFTLTNRSNCNFIHQLLEDFERNRSKAEFFPTLPPPIERFVSLFISSPEVLDELFQTKNINGDTPMHLLARFSHPLIPALLKMSDRLIPCLQIPDQNGNTAIHFFAGKNAAFLLQVFDNVQPPSRVTLLRSKDRLGDTPLHIAVTQTQNSSVVKQVISCLPNSEDRFQVLKVTNKLAATPLHVALAHGNLRTCEIIVEILGDENSLACIGLEDNSLPIGIRQLCSTAESIEALYEGGINHQLSPTALYYLMSVVGRNANQSLKASVQRLQTQEYQSKVYEITQMLIENVHQALTHLDGLCFHDGNSLLHILAAGNEIQDSVTVLNQFLPHIKISGRSSIMSRQNFAGRTPLDMACDYKIRRLLEWSDSQEGFYYLLSPPVVLLMYTTENRDGAEQESQSIERAFPEFNIPIRKKENPTRQDMTSAILNSVEGRDDVSALIVIIMSHGAQGVVCATDGDVSIQDILLQMQGAVAQPGRPKVLLVQACQSRDPNNVSSVAAAENNDALPGGQAAAATSAHQTTQSSQLQHISTIQAQDYSIQWNDFITLVATVKGGVAYRNQMIPVFAEELKNSEHGDIYEVFLKTCRRLGELIPHQIPELRSTLSKKLSLRRIFSP